MSKQNSSTAHLVKRTLSELLEQRVVNEEPLRTFGVQTIKELDMIADQLSFEFRIELSRHELFPGMTVSELIALVNQKLNK